MLDAVSNVKAIAGRLSLDRARGDALDEEAAEGEIPQDRILKIDLASKAIRWGEQSWEEMLVGFFDVAVPAGMDKWKFFVREGAVKPGDEQNP